MASATGCRVKPSGFVQVLERRVARMACWLPGEHDSVGVGLICEHRRNLQSSEKIRFRYDLYESQTGNLSASKLILNLDTNKPAKNAKKKVAG